MHRLVLAVAALALGLAACEGCRASRQGATVTSPTVSSTPTARLYLLTDVAGALEPCGCTQDQLGGLGHLGAWIKQARAQAPAAAIAAAGPLFFMDAKLDPERADQDRAKAHAIARVLGSLGFAAFAPGANDWLDGPATLASLATESGSSALGPGATVVRDVGGLKVAFIGCGQPEGGAPFDAEGAVRKGVAEAQKEGANVLVVLASVGRGEAKRIADAVPELTAVVVGSARADGDANTTAPPVERVGDVLIVQTANHLQSAAVLDLYAVGPVAPGQRVAFADGTGLELARERTELSQRIDELHVKIANWQRDPSIAPADVGARKGDLGRLEAEREALDARRPPTSGNFFRYALEEVRESLGTDAAIEADMRAYYKAVDEHNRDAFATRVPRPPAPGEASYVGVEVCTSCHADARRVWDGTSHAHAYATLSTQFKEFNLDCVSCHVTGYDRPGGSTVTHVEPLKNVQCEVCHGPGSKHVKTPGDPALLVARPPDSACLACHHPPHVEQFDALAKMKEILGPGHGMKRN